MGKVIVSLVIYLNISNFVSLSIAVKLHLMVGMIEIICNIYKSILIILQNRLVNLDGRNRKRTSVVSLGNGMPDV